MPIKFEPWEVLDRQLLLSAKPWFEIWCEEVRLPDGRIIPDYYKFTVPDSSVVVAMTPDRKILVARQYKHGVGTTMWVLPAGFLNKGEPPLHCAQRELLEETGYQAEEWIDLGNYIRDPSRGGGSIYVFLALDAHKVSEPNSGDLEDLQVQLLSMDDLLVAVRKNQIKGLGFVVAILLAKLYLEHQNRNS